MAIPRAVISLNLARLIGRPTRAPVVYSALNNSETKLRYTCPGFDNDPGTRWITGPMASLNLPLKAIPGAFKPGNVLCRNLAIIAY